MYGYGGWGDYVPVAERRRRAARELAKLAGKGQPVSPVVIDGRAITTTFWGKAWSDNLESYRDFENRLPRGRSYVRNGSVLDLQIAPREVTAVVSGTSLYRIKVQIDALPPTRWRSICKDCAGGIDSLVELLQGRLSQGVMERICRQGVGLFPEPRQIGFNCSCPDYASMCKHVAAVLYGVGARLDHQPELLFRLRAVDEKDLLSGIDQALPRTKAGAGAGKVLQSDDLSAMFGLDMAEAEPPAPAPARRAAAVKPKPRKKKRAAKPAKRRVPAVPGQPSAALRRSRLSAGHSSREL
jgi:uncharacterized Zn finger protein